MGIDNPSNFYDFTMLKIFNFLKKHLTEHGFKVSNFLEDMNDNATLDKCGEWMYNMSKSGNITTKVDMAMLMTRSINKPIHCLLITKS